MNKEEEALTKNHSYDFAMELTNCQYDTKDSQSVLIIVGHEAENDRIECNGAVSGRADILGYMIADFLQNNPVVKQVVTRELVGAILADKTK